MVDGTKAFATSALGADWAILLVNTAGPGGARHLDGADGSLLMLACPLSHPSITVDTSWWDPIGMRGTASHVVHFDRTPIPDSWRIGWSTGVAVVTSATADGPVGCTVSAVTSVSIRPPLLLVSLAEGSRTLDAIQRRRRFGLNLLPAQRCDLARQFATGEPASRFAGVEYDWAEGVPVLRQVVTSAVCQTERCLTVADHVLVVAAPVWWLGDIRRPPLVCFDRAYWSLWSMARIGGH